ncbi:MAG: fatty acid desaturase [Gammaproteobacteria bacterium]|jgi:stearoyl-CoA desaturase (delta-9 desaturase)
MLYGLLDLSFWQYIVVTLVLTHLTIAGVTIYLHRHQAHRALDLHPIISHFFRFWLWLTTGMVTRQWSAIHRKHHARVETPDDPHSPQIFGIRKVLFQGAELYRQEARNEETIRRYGHGAPDDWLERHLYTPHASHGVLLMLALDLVLFGIPGITIWAVQMMWIPFFAAGVINGVGHWGGYRNYETRDSSTNIVPWGVLIGGEELHNNHHAFASSAKFSNKWWEFDIGWLYIRTFQLFGLAHVKKTMPKPVMAQDKARLDVEALSVILSSRLQVMAQYARNVVSRVHKEELQKADAPYRQILRRAKSLLVREESLLTPEARERLESVLSRNNSLRTVYQYKRQLQAIWQERTASHERLLQSLQEWCKEAEATGIRALQDFARSLPRYSLHST